MSCAQATADARSAADSEHENHFPRMSRSLLLAAIIKGAVVDALTTPGINELWGGNE